MKASLEFPIHFLKIYSHQQRRSLRKLLLLE